MQAKNNYNNNKPPGSKKVVVRTSVRMYADQQSGCENECTKKMKGRYAGRPGHYARYNYNRRDRVWRFQG